MDIISPRQSKVKLGNLDLRKEGRQLPASWRAAETHHVAQMIYFTSDTHFGDPRVLQIDRRPFPDMTAHDLALIENWNERVGNEGVVWHLGDFMSARAGRLGVDRIRLRWHRRLGVLVDAFAQNSEALQAIATRTSALTSTIKTGLPRLPCLASVAVSVTCPGLPVRPFEFIIAISPAVAHLRPSRVRHVPRDSIGGCMVRLPLKGNEDRSTPNLVRFKTGRAIAELLSETRVMPSDQESEVLS
jgi:hypothetical protein